MIFLWKRAPFSTNKPWLPSQGRHGQADASEVVGKAAELLRREENMVKLQVPVTWMTQLKSYSTKGQLQSSDGLTFFGGLWYLWRWLMGSINQRLFILFSYMISTDKYPIDYRYKIFSFLWFLGRWSSSHTRSPSALLWHLVERNGDAETGPDGTCQTSGGKDLDQVSLHLSIVPTQTIDRQLSPQWSRGV